MGNKMKSEEYYKGNGKEIDVIVVGGGISGVTAAKRLMRKKMNVLLLQAGEDIGGRMKTSEIQIKNGHTFSFDEGASWIHGYSSKNPLK